MRINLIAQVREMIINQKNGSKYMMTKYHMDQMVSVDSKFSIPAFEIHLIIVSLNFQKTATRLTRETQLLLGCAAQFTIYTGHHLSGTVRHISYPASERFGDDVAQ